MSSSDSDSDDEEKKKLASVVNGYEASVKTTTNVKNALNPSKDPHDKKVPASNKKSLRNNPENNDDFNVMQTTPEFRQFMSKKLDAFLEGEISDYPETILSTSEINDNEMGVKLLKGSNVFLSGSNIMDEIAQHNKSRCKKKPVKRKSQSSSDSDDSDEEEEKRFRLAAITPESVLSGTAIKAHKKD